MASLAESRRNAAMPFGDLRWNHLSSEVVNRLSDWNEEPEWLRERRLAARRIYEALPQPRWERGIRGWWTTDVSGLHLDEIAPYSLTAPEPRPGHSSSTAAGRAGLVVQRDSAVIREALDSNLESRGVIFTSLSRAARDYPSIVRNWLNTLVTPEEDKFVALHAALWSGGVLAYVPAGVELVKPLQARFELRSPHLAAFVHTLIVAERGSRVTYLEDYTSASSSGQGLHSGVVEVHAEEGAEVQVVTVHNWGESVYNFSLNRAAVGRNARMRWVAGFLGSGLTRAAVDTRLRQPGAELEVLGIFFGSGKQHLDLTTRTYHEAPHTSGDVLFKGVVNQHARSSLEGLIRVEKGAQQTTSYLSDHTLQLSRDAKSDAIPSLEIEANDVRVSHGATVGMIDEEQLYYLMARGLHRVDAEKMIVAGFFDPVLRRIPIASTRNDLLATIERKMGA